MPGITAALGCAASIGLPLTQRGRNMAITLITGASEDGIAEQDWAALAKAGAATAIYMGVGAAPHIAARLIAAGIEPTTPVTIVENGTLQDERTIRDQRCTAGAGGARRERPGNHLYRPDKSAAVGRRRALPGRGVECRCERAESIMTAPVRNIDKASPVDTGKVLTANRLADGVVVFLTRSGQWSERIDDAALALEPGAAAALESRGEEAVSGQSGHRPLSVRCGAPRRPGTGAPHPRAHSHARPIGPRRSRQAGRRAGRRFPADGVMGHVSL